jgi:hypothetical protein
MKMTVRSVAPEVRRAEGYREKRGYLVCLVGAVKEITLAARIQERPVY